MKKLLLPLLLMGSLVAAPGAMAAEADNKFLVIKTADGKEVRVAVHPEDVSKLQGAKKGDKIELFFIPGLLGEPVTI